MGGAGRAPSAHHTLEPTQAGRWQASTQGGRDKSLSEHGRWLVCWLPGTWHFSGMKSQDGGGKLLSLQAGEGAWDHGRSPGHFGGLVSSLARPEAGVSRWPRGRHGVCSHADWAGPGQTCFPPRPSTHIPLPKDRRGPGKAGRSAGTGRGQTPVWGLRVLGAVSVGRVDGRQRWTHVWELGQGARRAGGTPTCGRGGQGLPAEARRSDHSNRKGRGTGTWPGACGVRRAQTLLRLFLGAGGTGRKAPAESGPGRADGGPGGEEDGLRPGDGASWQGPSGCASAQKAGSWVEPGLAAGERVPG